MTPPFPSSFQELVENLTPSILAAVDAAVSSASFGVPSTKRTHEAAFTASFGDVGDGRLNDLWARNGGMLWVVRMLRDVDDAVLVRIEDRQRTDCGSVPENMVGILARCILDHLTPTIDARCTEVTRRFSASDVADVFEQAAERLGWVHEDDAPAVSGAIDTLRDAAGVLRGNSEAVTRAADLLMFGKDNDGPLTHTDIVTDTLEQVRSLLDWPMRKINLNLEADALEAVLDHAEKQGEDWCPPPDSTPHP